MAVGKPFVDGPAYVAASATDMYTSPDSTNIAQVRHIHLANTSASAINVKLYVGATGASTGGTEIYDADIPADSVDDIYFPAGLPITSSLFIVGIAGTISTVAATITGDLIVA